MVDLIHGRLNRLEVDENGKIFLGGKDDDYACIYLGGCRWEELLDTGKRFGWIPAGTILTSRINVVDEVRSDYEPASWNSDEIYKVFTATDACSLSNALQSYIDEIYGKNDIGIKKDDNKASGFVKEEYTHLGYDFLKKVIDFMRKGDFIFVWDD